jgi:protein-S-isoprenylcysteine O-methyltransferase Ste14
MSQNDQVSGGRDFAALVFAKRRFISSGTLAVILPVKLLLGGMTNLTLWASGLVLVVIGIASRIFTSSFLCGRHIVTEIEAESLCLSGPFSYVRNPLYIGNFIIGVGVALAFNEWYGYLCFAMEFGLMYSIIIPYEERFLRGKFGPVYENYRKATRRFIPRWKAYPDDTDTQPDFGKAAWGERIHGLVLAVIFTLFYFLFLP